MSTQNSAQWFNPTSDRLEAGGNGIIASRLSTTQRTALALTSADAGLTSYDVTLQQLFVWNGTAWANSTLPAAFGDGQVLFSSAGSITGSSQLTFASAGPANLSLQPTWNNAATTFTGALLNVTDTASSATSALQEWQVGGARKSVVGKDGSVGGNAFCAANTSSFISQATALVYAAGGSSNGRCLSASGNIGAGIRGLVVDATSAFCWSSLTASASVDGASGGNADTFLYRDAANTFAQRNGVNAQGFRVYNTYTDASNYERGVFDWQTTANTLTIGTVAAGTGTLRAVQLIGSNATVSASAGGFVAFATNSTNRWYVNSSGGFVAFVDNTYDFGGISANRCKSAYFSSSVKITGATSALEAWNTDAAVSTVNYEKGVFDWATTANVLTIGTQKSGTGNNRNVSLVATGALNLLANIGASANTGQQIDVNGNLCPQQSGSTTATGRFVSLQSGPGAPTGAPAPAQGVAVYIDTTNSKFYAYIGAVWKGVVLV